MRFVYQEWDGSDSPTQEHLSQFAGFLDYVMEYGDQAMEALRQAVEDPEQRKLVEKWIEDRLLERAARRWDLSL